MLSKLASQAKRKFSRSHGLRRLFWLAVLAVTTILPLAQYAPARELMLKAARAILARLHTDDPGSLAEATTGSTEVYFTEPGRSPGAPCEIIRALVRHIDEARVSLDVCAFELDNVAVCNALVQAVKRGVRVRLVTETNYIDEAGVQMLRDAGVPVVDDGRSSALMHNKFIVFDQQAVWTGSMNFTENCAYRNNNHAVYLANADLAANYATKFAWMFEQRKFGGLPQRSARIPHPRLTLADGTVVENYFSSHDHVADRVIEAIRQAKKSVHFLAFSFTHDGIANAMLERAGAGVEIGGVFERTQASGGHTEFNRLRAAGAGVSVYLDANPRNMHHKVIVIDNAIAIVGSFNFSDNADKNNDENLLILHNPAVARRFEEEYQRVHGEAMHAEKGTPLAGHRR